VKARKYRVDVYWSEEDNLYLAEVPELPGCVTHGETAAEAARNAEEAIEAWIEMAEEMGDPVPEPTVEKRYSGRFVARLPRDLHRRLVEEAQRQSVSLNQYVVSRLSEAASGGVQRASPVAAPSDDPLLRTVRQYLEGEASGRGKAKTTDEIARAVGLEPTTENTRVRHVIRRLVFEEHVPIVGSSRGYFVAQNADEVRSAARSLQRHRKKIAEREKLLGLLKNYLEVEEEERTQESVVEASRELMPPK
jgi:antitoxin HicB